MSDGIMKDNLHSACMLFLVFLLFTAGFVGPGSATEDVGLVSATVEPYNYLKDYSSSELEPIESPIGLD